MLHGHYIKWANQVKYLGASLNSYFTFSPHVNTIICKAADVQGMLFPILNSKSPIFIKSKIQIYQIYIRPFITYTGPLGAHVSLHQTRPA